MKRKAIIVDLDGTLCNTDHRQHFMTSDKKDWNAFYSAMVNDEPNQWCKDLVRIYSGEGRIIFVSGRPEEYMEITKKWLSRYGISYDLLLMRLDGDFRKDCIIKQEIYEKHIQPHYEILFCVDDRKQVVDMWRSLGLVCLQCAEGNF